MTDRGRREMIARYLNGAMDIPETAQFLERVEADPRLRTLLDTERLIRRTMEHDRRSMSNDHTTTRRRVMGMLGTLPPAGTASMVKGAAGGLSQTAKIMLTAGFGIGAIVVGTVVVNPPGNRQEAGTQHTQIAPPQIPASPPEMRPAQAQPETVSPETAPPAAEHRSSDATAPADREQGIAARPAPEAVDGSAARHRTAAGAGNTRAQDVRTRESRTAVLHTEKPAADGERSGSRATDSRTTSTPRIVRKDSVNVRVHVKAD